jgi:DNA invertase Pin-like site-specific DNA recombinase
VVDKAVQSVYNDSMAMRRVTDRLARDFWVQPSESMIRHWCRTYSAQFDFEVDYQSWVVSEFSGILCVDEVYQDQMALLLAVDPASPGGDWLVGYRLVHGNVSASDMERFLSHLKGIGVEPDQVITDGSKLYPTVLGQVWPSAAHQLCLFHETRHMTNAVMKLVNAIRKEIPHPPPVPSVRSGGPLYAHPPTDDLTDPATQRWYWRQADRRAKIARVHALAEQGLSQRAIARQTGHHRDTVKRWLKQSIPPLPENMPAKLSDIASLPGPLQNKAKKKLLMHRVHGLRDEGLSYSAIARQVGIHRVTVKAWLQKEPPPLEECAIPVLQEQVDLVPPAAPWSSWDEVRHIREALREHRFLMLRRPENLSPAEQQQLTGLLNSPLGPELKVARSFLIDWYRLWRDEEGCRRSLEDARARYVAWRTNPTYRSVPKLRRVQDRITVSRFEQVSQFLRNPEWRSTNNGAERTGRAFRHRQAPHFNLRKEESIEHAIVVNACLHKEAAARPPPQPFHTCQRGRRKAAGVSA